jgi:hypothetical protein
MRYTIGVAVPLIFMLTGAAHAAEREQVRQVVNLVAAVKAPYPDNLRRWRSRTENAVIAANHVASVCLRVDNRRWCYEHIPPFGAEAEMFRIRAEPQGGLSAGTTYTYVVDYDLDGMVDVGSTTRIERERENTLIGSVVQFFHRGTNRGDQFRADYQSTYDEGIRVALRYLGE